MKSIENFSETFKQNPNAKIFWNRKSTAIFKTVTIDSEEQLMDLTNKLDKDQRLVLSI